MWAAAYLYFYCKFHMVMEAKHFSGFHDDCELQLWSFGFYYLVTDPSNTDVSIIKLLLSEVYARQ